MISSCIRCESFKLKHAKIWIACLLIPILSAVLGTFNYQQNLGTLKLQWYSLWTQHTLFYTNFFFAPLVALYCSYLWRLEHYNSNWNTLMTMPVTVFSLYLGKFVTALKLTFLTQVWIGILFFFSGKAVGLPGSIPFPILIWLLRGLLGAVVIIAVQLYLSMRIRSFAIPIVIALLGSIAGLMANAIGIGQCFPYSLMMLAMNANSETEILSCDTIAMTSSAIVYFAIFLSLGLHSLRNADIKTN